MQSRCEAQHGTLLMTARSNCHRRHDNGRPVALQHNVADDLRSLNCDMKVHDEHEEELKSGTIALHVIWYNIINIS